MIPSENVFGSLHERVAKICTPVFLQGNMFGFGHSQSTPNGTITFIKASNTVYYCTCKHILDSAININNGLEHMKTLQIMGERVICNLNSALFVNKNNPSNFAFYPPFKVVNDLDLALMPVPMDHFKLYAKSKQKTFIDIDALSSPNYSKIDMLHAFGWPTEHKSMDENHVITGMAGSYAELQTKPLKPEIESFLVFSELKEDHGYFFSGMSGGPVVYYEEDNDEYYPLGIIYEGNPGSQKSFEKDEPGLFTKKTIMYKCYHLTRDRFYYWLSKSQWLWSLDPRLKDYERKQQ